MGIEDKEKNIKRISLILSIIFLVLMPVTVLNDYLNFSANNKIEIYSENEKNQFSQGKEVWLISLVADNVTKKIILEPKDNNKLKYDRVYLNGENNEKITFYTEANDSIKLSLLKHKWSGKVSVFINDTLLLQNQDLYSEKEDVLEVSSTVIGATSKIHFKLIIIVFAMFVFFYKIFSFLLRKISKMDSNNNVIIQNNKKEFLFHLLFSVVTLSCILVLCSPALMSSDSLDQWFQMTTNVYSNHHPIYHTLFMKLLLYIYNSPTTIALAQILIFAFTISFICHHMLNLGIDRRYVWIFNAIMTLNPVNGFLTITLWKDIVYSISLLGMTFLLFLMYKDKFKVNNKLHIFVFFMYGIACTLFRHNGIASLLGIIIAVLILSKSKKRTKILLLTSLVGAILIIVVSTLKIVNPTPVNSGYKLANPFVQHISAVIYNNGDISEDEKVFLNKLMPLESWKKYYTKYSMNGLYYNQLSEPNNPVDFVNNLKDNQKEVIKTWTSLLLKNPLIMIKQSIAMNSILINMIVPVDGYMYVDNLEIQPNDLGIKSYSIIPDSLNPKDFIFSAISHGPSTILFSRPALYLFGLFFIAGAILINRERKFLWIFTPLVINVCSLVPTVAAQDFRYLYYLTLIVPMGFLLIPCVNKRKDKAIQGNIYLQKEQKKSIKNFFLKALIVLQPVSILFAISSFSSESNKLMCLILGLGTGYLIYSKLKKNLPLFFDENLNLKIIIFLLPFFLNLAHLNPIFKSSMFWGIIILSGIIAINYLLYKMNKDEKQNHLFDNISTYILINISYGLFLYHVIFSVSVFSPDSYSYYEISKNIFNNFMSVNTIRQYVILNDMNISFPYLYPMLISIVNTIFGLKIYSGVVINVISGLLTIFMLIKISDKFTSSKTLGILTAITITNNTFYLDELLAARAIPVIILILLFALYLYQDDNWSIKRSFCFGILIGLGAVIRFDFIIYTVGVTVFVILSKILRKKKSFKYYIVGVIIPLLPWILYSTIHYGNLWITDNKGTVFLVDILNPQHYFMQKEYVATMFNSFEQWRHMLISVKFPTVINAIKLCFYNSAGVVVILCYLMVMFRNKKGNKILLEAKMICVLEFIVLLKTIVLMFFGYGDIRYHLDLLMMTILFVGYTANTSLKKEGLLTQSLIIKIVVVLLIITNTGNLISNNYIKNQNTFMNMIFLPRTESKDFKASLFDERLVKIPFDDQNLSSLLLNYENEPRIMFLGGNPYRFGSYTGIKTYCQITNFSVDDNVYVDRIYELNKNALKMNFIYIADDKLNYVPYLSSKFEMNQISEEPLVYQIK